ncbi:hypothetical protein [Rhizobium anhuiense]|uniref:hypothetical protein n=1 Tax=Rhizobium anhuiense TaxID=1184720 RepID=UPI0014417F56|nr:hypothetical protein [Rhizobium anhuiense]
MTTDKITLEFTPATLAVIDQALQGLPFRVAAPVLAEIARQIAERVRDEDIGPKAA